jgi:threonine dehydratase
MLLELFAYLGDRLAYWQDAIAVEADAAESLRVGHIVRWDAERVGRTAADGMRTSSLGRLTFRHLTARLEGVLTVSEPVIRRAMVTCVGVGS